MNTTRGKRCLVRSVAALVVASLAVPAPAGTWQSNQTTGGKRWAMKYETGTQPIKQGTTLNVTVGNDQIVCDAESGRAFAIPVAGVKEITYDTKVRRRLAEAAAVAILSLGVAAIFVALKTKKHFVNVVWQEDGTDKEAVFKVGKGDYAAFLGDLQRVTGKEWKNLEMEQEMARQALKSQRGNKIAVQIDRNVQLIDALLKPGLHQMILLEHAGNRGELYFFRGTEVDVKKIAGTAVVEIQPAVAGTTAVVVMYKGEGATAGIAEIRLPTKTLRLL